MAIASIGSSIPAVLDRRRDVGHDVVIRHAVMDRLVRGDDVSFAGFADAETVEFQPVCKLDLRRAVVQLRGTPRGCFCRLRLKR